MWRCLQRKEMPHSSKQAFCSLDATAFACAVLVWHRSALVELQSEEALPSVSTPPQWPLFRNLLFKQLVSIDNQDALLQVLA